MDRTKQENCIDEVLAERQRQEQLKEEGKFRYTCSDGSMTDAERLAVLVEEVGEVSKEVLGVCEQASIRHFTMDAGKRRTSEYDETVIRDHLKAELAQVAAVAVAWMESI